MCMLDSHAPKQESKRQVTSVSIATCPRQSVEPRPYNRSPSTVSL